MSERVRAHDLTVAELVAAKAGSGQIEVEIPIPAAAKRWTLLVKPVDSGPAGGAPDAKIQYAMRGVFSDVTPGGGTVSFPNNVAGIITREDVVPRVKLVFTLPADPQPDGGILIDLNIAR